MEREFIITPINDNSKMHLSILDLQQFFQRVGNDSPHLRCSQTRPCVRGVFLMKELVTDRQNSGRFFPTSPP